MLLHVYPCHHPTCILLILLLQDALDNMIEKVDWPAPDEIQVRFHNFSIVQ